MTEAVRLYPHETNGEGQFVAVLKKNGEPLEDSIRFLKLKRNEKVEKFLNSQLNFNEKVYDFVDFSYFCPDTDLIRTNINYVSIGVRVAKTVSNVIKPEHYLFSAFGEKFYLKYNLKLNSNEIGKYLKGDIFGLQGKDGYGAIMVENVPLGGFKLSNGEMKNLYPKGLRNLK